MSEDMRVERHECLGLGTLIVQRACRLRKLNGLTAVSRDEPYFMQRELHLMYSSLMTQSIPPFIHSNSFARENDFCPGALLHSFARENDSFPDALSILSVQRCTPRNWRSCLGY